MKISTIERTTFDKLKFPSVVYKYREAQNDKHRTILTEQVVFFAPPISFEDKLDCKIPVRYDLITDDEIYEHYLKTLREENPLWDQLYLRDQAIQWSNLGLMRDKNRLELIDEHYFQLLNARYGVLSLTAKPALKKMWRKYSADFDGFCIGFNPKVMFKFLGGGSIVQYFPTLPIIMPFDSFDQKIVTNTYSKLKKWGFEKEYRTHIFWPQPIEIHDRQIKLPNSAFVEIILGHNLNSNSKKEIVAQARQVNSQIQIKITYLKNNRVHLRPYA